jgi:hypothetical protein
MNNDFYIKLHCAPGHHTKFYNDVLFKMIYSKSDKILYFINHKYERNFDILIQYFYSILGLSMNFTNSPHILNGEVNNVLNVI